MPISTSEKLAWSVQTTQSHNSSINQSTLALGKSTYYLQDWVYWCTLLYSLSSISSYYCHYTNLQLHHRPVSWDPYNMPMTQTSYGHQAFLVTSIVNAIMCWSPSGSMPVMNTSKSLLKAMSLNWHMHRTPVVSFVASWVSTICGIHSNSSMQVNLIN